MRWALVALLVSGCSALTDFDYTIGPADAGADASASDAGLDAGRDAGRMDDLDAGTDAGSDAGVVLSPCPAPCIGDLAADYDPGAQGSGAVQWRYVADPRDRLGIVHPELPWDLSTETYVSGTASIGACGEASCPAGALLVVAPGDATEATPAIELTATTTGTFRVGVAYAPMGAGAMQFVLSREHRADAVLVVDVPDGAAPGLASREVFLAIGDRLRVTVRSTALGVAPRVALNVWISGPTPADECLTSIDFDVWPAPMPQHGLYSVELNSPPTEPTMSPAADPELGSALRISAADGSWVRLVGSEEMDLSGDFTVQLWARREVLGTGQYEAIVASPGVDAAVGLDGGLALFVDDTETPPALELGVYRRDTDDQIVRTIRFDPGTDWHFYRIVRSGDAVLLCADGARLVSAAAPGDYTSTNTMRFGRFGTDGVWFTGSIDEVRIFTEALPCEVAP